MTCLLVATLLSGGSTAHADEAGSTGESTAGTTSSIDPWSPDRRGTALDLPIHADGNDPDHRWLSLGLLGGVYTGFSTWAYFAWYDGFPPLDQFKVGGDGYFGLDTYAGGADKLGHFWANMTLARAANRLLRWGGWGPRTSAAIAGGATWTLFLFVEIKDGFFYEMSPGDLLANTLGNVVGLILESSPRLDRLIDIRVEYWPSDDYRAVLRGDDHEINQVNVAEDYSGERYLLALHLGEVNGLGDGEWTRWTRYVDGVVGFHTDNFKPEPVLDPGTPYDKRQELYLGVSLNAQGVIDDLLGGRGGAAGVARSIGHGLFEVFNVPFSSVRVVGLDREERETTPSR